MNNQLVTIIGPTAIGKTDLAIKIAEFYNTEIVSADSRQFYKELNIGVAKPNKKQLKQIKHHLIGHLSIKQKYSIGQYETDTLNLIKKLWVYPFMFTNTSY